MDELCGMNLGEEASECVGGLVIECVIAVICVVSESGVSLKR